MVRHLARVLAGEVRLDLLDGGRDRLGPALDDGFAEPDEAGVGVDLEEQPPRLDEERFEPGDLESALGVDGRVGRVGDGGRGQPDGRGRECFTSVHGEAPVSSARRSSSASPLVLKSGCMM